MAGAVLVGTRGVTAGSSLTTGAGTSSANATFAACISLGNAGAVSTVTDNKGNTYTKRGGTSLPLGRTDLNATEVWVVENGVGGAGHTLTVTFTNSSVYAVGHLIELQGVTTAPVDVVIAANQGTAPPLVINTGTLAQADEVILVLAAVVPPGSTATYTDGTGTYTLLSQETDNSNYWTSSVWTKVVASTASTATSITVSEGSSTFPAGNLITFKVASSASPAADFDYAHKSGDIAAGATTGVVASSATSSRRGILVASATIAAGAITAAAAIVGSAGIAESSASTQVAAQYEVARASGAASGASTIANTLSANALRPSGNLASGVPPSLGSHGEDHDLQGPVSNSLQIAMSTQSGSTFLVFHAGMQGNADPTDNKSNSLARLVPWTLYPTWDTFGVEMFGVVDGVGGADHVFTVDKVPSTRPDEEASAIAVEVIGGTQIVGPDITYIATASPPYSTPTVTVDGPATVLALWAGEDGGGPHTVSASDGFTFVDGWLDGISGSIQFALFSKTVTNAGTYGTTFTSTPSQGGLFGICAVRGGSASPSAVLTVAASSATSRASGRSTAAAVSTILASSETSARASGVTASASVPPLGSISAASESTRAQALLDASGSVGLAFNAAQAAQQPATVISANTAILASFEASASGALSASAQSEILASSSTAGRPAELSASATIPIPGQIHASFVYSANVGAPTSSATLSVLAAGNAESASAWDAGAAVTISANGSAMSNGVVAGTVTFAAPPVSGNHLTIVFPESVGTIVFPESIRTVIFTY